MVGAVIFDIESIDDIKDDPFVTDILCYQPVYLANDTTKAINDMIDVIDRAESFGKRISLLINTSHALSKDLTFVATSYDIFLLKNLPCCLERYLDAIRKHLHRIEKVEMSWTADHTSGAYFRWIGGRSYRSLMKNAMRLLIEPTQAEFEKMASFMPDIMEAGKLSFLAVEAAFEREAFLFQDKLEEAPLLGWLKQNSVSVNIVGGAWVLDKDLEEHLLKYAIVRNARSPIHVYRGRYDAGEYPYEYYQRYLKEAEFHSGIGYHLGIARGNAKNLINIGYKKVWFWTEKGGIGKSVKAWRQWIKEEMTD